MKGTAKETFEKLDVKKNLGLDFYQFETHVRDFVLELIEPTVQKMSDDHQIIQELSNGYEGLRQKLDTLVFDTNKFHKKAVTQNEFHLRIAEVERNIVRNSETINTDLKKLNASFEVVKDKIAIVQADLSQFNKINSGFSEEFVKVNNMCDQLKDKLMEEILSRSRDSEEAHLDIKKRIARTEEEIRSCRHIADGHTQFIREYEIRQSIFQSRQLEILGDEAAKIADDTKKSFKEFDIKMMKQRIDFSDEVQIQMKNSREEVLKMFRHEYMAKRHAKGTQASHLDNANRQQNHISVVEIWPSVDIKEIEIDREWLNSRPKSQRRPRRDKLPRVIGKLRKRKRTEYHLLPRRECLTDGERSVLSPSELMERYEDVEMEKRIAQRILEERSKTAKALALQAAMEQERIRKEQEELAEKTKTIEELVVTALPMETDILRKASYAELEDPEFKFLQEEEQQLQQFYEHLFPADLLKEGMPNYARFLKLINTEELKPEDLFRRAVEKIDLNLIIEPRIEVEESTPLSHQDTPTIGEWKPKKPDQVIEKPETPNMDLLPPQMKAHNYYQLYEYMQDSLLQLRDEVTVRVNEQLINQETKQLQQFAKINERFIQMQKNGGGGGSKFQPSIPAQFRQSLDMSSVHDSISMLDRNMLGASGTLSVTNKDGIIENINLQAAIEGATQLVIEKSRQEFLAGIHDQLRKAQARVIAHMRMDNRSLLKMWSLRIRKEVVSWLAKAQQDWVISNEYAKSLDERGRKCETMQFEILEQVQRQMKGLEEKFNDLKENQQKILFGAKDEDESDVNQEDEEGGDQFMETDRTPSLSQSKYNRSVGQQPPGIAQQLTLKLTSTNTSVAPTPVPQSPISTQHFASSRQLAQFQQQSQKQSPRDHGANISFQQLPPAEEAKQLALFKSPTRSQANSAVSSQGVPPKLNLQGIQTPQDDVKALSRHEQSVHQASQHSGIGIQLNVQSTASLQQIDIQPTEIILPPNIYPPGLEQLKAADSHAKQEIPVTTAIQLQKQVEPTRSPISQNQTPSPQKPVGSPTRGNASSPFRRAIIPSQQNESPTNPQAMRSFRQAVRAVGNVNRVSLEAEKKQIQNAVDPKTQAMLKQHKVKLNKVELQIMALMSQFKMVEVQQRELEEFKVKNMIIDYFKEQMESLNFDKLKSDFYEFQIRMKVIETQTTEKMKQVQMLYEEVEGGFQRNARDRSDYLVDQQRLYNLAENQVNTFKDQMMEFDMKLSKLSTCILSIVNEEEAAQIKKMVASGSSTYQMEDQHIRVDIPQAQAISNQNVTPEPTIERQESVVDPIPRRNYDSGKYKDITDLSKEITYQTAKNQSSLAFYFDKSQLLHKNTLLPSVANKTKTQNLTQLNETGLSSVQAPQSQKKTSSRFNYTDFVDQALISSINNAPLDLKNANQYTPQYSNPLLRASVNGVVSHRIKNLLGTGIGANSGQIMNSNYSQGIIDTPLNYSMANASALQSQGGSTIIDYGEGQQRKKHHSSVKKEYLISTGGGSSLVQLSKNDMNFDNVKNLSSQRRGHSQLDHYNLKLHKQMIIAHGQIPSPGARNAEDGHNPIMLQALIGTHSIQSKDNIPLISGKKRMKVRLTHEKYDPYYQATNQPLTLESDATPLPSKERGDNTPFN